MKIGLVLPYNIARGGGVKEHVLAQHAELTKRGHHVVIVTPQPRETFHDNNRQVAFLGSATDFRSPLATTTQLSASVLTDEIDALLDYEQFDILHFHEPWVPVLSRQILSRSRSVNVATFHAKLPETLMSRTMAKVITPYTKPLLRYINEFTAVSDAAAEYLLSLADVQVDIIPNGIDLHHFSYRRRRVERTANEMKTILYIGRLERRKGVRYLIEAFSSLQAKQPNVRLLLAGDGPDREKLQQLARELQVQHVEFLGFIDDTTKLELLRSADLFCSPAIFGESFGIVLLEAMASGLVTVAGNNAGYTSVMQDMGKLSLVNPKDRAEFTHRLQLLLNDEDLRRLWRSWAREAVKQYDYPRVVDMYEAVYKTALMRHGRHVNAPQE